MTKADAQNEVANIEAHIKALLPADYLASIGADERGYTHERHLNLRCMRIFDDLANRLAALSSAPPDLENLVLAYQRLCRKRDEAHANGQPATALDAEFELKGIHYGLLAWTPAPPVAETPVDPPINAYVPCWCGHLHEDHDPSPPYDCRACRQQAPKHITASPVVAPAPVVETRGEVPPSSTWGDLGPAAKCSRCGDDGSPCSHCETALGGGR